MSLTINTNVESLNAQHHRIQRVAKSFERLSSGVRINAGDNSGLGVSEKMRASVRSLSQGSRNTQDGISLLQTAEGVYADIANILIRMRELAVQPANGTPTNADRPQLTTEYAQLIDKITRLTEATKFEGLELITEDSSLTVGEKDTADASAGPRKRDDTRLRDAAQRTTQAIPLTRIPIPPPPPPLNSLDTASTAESALKTIDAAIQSVNTARSLVGAGINRLASATASLATAVENLSAAQSRIRDVDTASESATLVRNQILSQAGASVLAQAQVQPSLALRLLG